jgi:hypothetical protein
VFFQANRVIGGGKILATGKNPLPLNPGAT